LEKVDVGCLSSNPNATETIKQHPDKINWNLLSHNPHKDAIEMLRQNPNRINWHHLSENEGAIELLEENSHKLHYMNLLMNPAIFEYDYPRMKRTTAVFKEELMAKAWRPYRIMKWLEQGYDEFTE